jgi:sugar-phosphatase
VQLAVRGFLFDLDGTLLDTSGPIGRSWTRWAGEHEVTAADFVRVGSHGRRSVDLVTALVSPERAATALARIHALELADLDGIVAVRGAAQLLRALPGAAWGIVTSGDRNLATARLRASQLAFAVDRLLVTGDEVHAGKPDPAPYAAGAAALGLEPADCLVVEDAPAGIVSGVAAGARTLALTTTVTREELTAADVVVADLTAVRVLSVADGIVTVTVDGAPVVTVAVDGAPVVTVADPGPPPPVPGARP